LKSPAAISNYPVENDKEEESSSKIPTDPYFPLQWYLRNTGQNGGKVRLDLNVSEKAINATARSLNELIHTISIGTSGMGPRNNGQKCNDSDYG
jgi:hypothetical protein